MKQWQKLSIYISVFLALYLIPFSSPNVEGAILESFKMVGEYAREHVLFCLIPAFFIAGAIAIFISQNAVLKYFGCRAKKWISYSVAAVSGTVLAVCSCTVLPLFAGLYTRGAGIGPAVAFLYSAPAINVLAIILTGRVLGWEFGLARAVGAIIFAIAIGLIMSLIFGKEDEERADFGEGEIEEARSGLQNILYFAVLIFILIFAAWARPEETSGFWFAVFQVKWPITIVLLGTLAFMLVKWFNLEEIKEWVDSSWDFAQKILPLLLIGVLAAGFLMGRPGTNGGIIPSEWISGFVGGNSLSANFVASILGALMYFATLTEVPILQGLLGAGMGKGPALALLLAGPALSLPNMLVIRSIMGTKKTAVYIILVVVMATLSGMIYGSFLG
ncbi:MAG: permease [Desulfitibacter sp. BRH_c19]|nr:MAG: permease [Desulfitibacter sp. BRH_c19]